MSSQDDKVDVFHRLHAEGCFVMPNPWDLGSAVALAGMGFGALATTSAGHAWRLDIGTATCSSTTSYGISGSLRLRWTFR